MKLNWNFLRRWGMLDKELSMVGVWIFSGTARYIFKTGIETDLI